MIAAMLFSVAANAQNISANDLCVATFGDGKTFYAKAWKMQNDR
jgi:hypothetical protein